MEPDHYLEEYWKQFKNFIKKLTTDYKIINNYIDLQDMCNVLNSLKTESRYIEIERHIEKYIAKVSWVLIKNFDAYHFNLIKTQLSRWKKVPSLFLEMNKYNIKGNFKHLVDPSFDMYISIVPGLINSDECYLQNYLTLFSKLNIPDYNGDVDDAKCIQHNMDMVLEILPFIVEDKKVGPLTTISANINITKKMEELYGLPIPYKMDGRKILNLLESKTNEKTDK